MPRPILPPYLLCWQVFWLVLPGPLCAQDRAPRQRVYYRVPFAIDLGQSQLSSMLIELSRDPIKQSALQYHEARTTVRENALSELFGALLRGDAPGLQALASPADPSVEEAANLAPALIFAVGESGATDLELIAEYPLSQGRSLIGWRPQAAGFERNYYFHLDWDEATGRIGWFPSESAGPVSSVGALIAEAERVVMRGDEVEVEFDQNAFRYSTPYGDLDAKLHFNGKSYRWNLARDPAPPGEVTEYYKKAYDALYSEGLDSFAEYFTEKSREKIKTWYVSFEDGQEEIFMRDLKVQNRHVVFMLDADPYFVVFYNTFSAGPAHDTLVRDPASGELRLTGFQMIGGVDVLLNDKEHFWKRVISPLASRGADPDDQASMPVVPAFLVEERERKSRASGTAGRDRGSEPSKGVLPGSQPSGAKGTRPAAEAQPGVAVRYWWWLIAIGIAGGVTVIILRRRTLHD